LTEGFLAILFFTAVFFVAGFLAVLFEDLVARLTEEIVVVPARREAAAADFGFAVFLTSFLAAVLRAVFAICRASTICSYSVLCLRLDV